jgi:hypothetical protein
MADVQSTLRLWSTTAGSNLPAGSTAIGAGLDDNLRELQAVVRKYLASKGSDMASATTLDLATADGYFVDVTGTTTITGLGTEAAGISYLLRFNDALTFTHNSTSLILPGAASITTANGDTALMTSLGSGNWKCAFYQKASGAAVVGTTAAAQSDQETATSTTTYVSPGRQHFHPSAIKAWGVITPATTVTASYPAAGVSATNPGTGAYVVTHGITLSSANYSINISQGGALVASITAKTTTTFSVTFTNLAGADTAPSVFYYQICGDL